MLALDGQGRLLLRDATFSNCPWSRFDWFLRADTVTLDRETSQGRARDAVLRFKGTPLLYTPFLGFPLGDERQSGLLAPNLGYIVVTG